MTTPFSILAWRIPRTEEPGGLQSIVSHSQTRLKWQRARARAHTCTHTHTHTHTAKYSGLTIGMILPKALEDAYSCSKGPWLMSAFTLRAFQPIPLFRRHSCFWPKEKKEASEVDWYINLTVFITNHLPKIIPPESTKSRIYCAIPTASFWSEEIIINWWGMEMGYVFPGG